jgi:hypothetical protein
MKSSRTISSVSLALVAVLASCSGKSAVVPATGAGADEPARVAPMGDVEATSPLRRAQGKSWALKGAAAVSTLIYVTEEGHGDVKFYNFDTLALEGTLTGFANPGQPCVDASGNVYIPDGSPSTVTEFAHGDTTPIRVLSGNNLSFPRSCSVNPENGDLAVTNRDKNYVLVYPSAIGTPVEYSDPHIGGTHFCAYDNTGNLFVDGVGRGFVLAELPKGSSTIVDLMLTNFSIRTAGNLAWDGTYLLVGEPIGTTSAIFQAEVSGTSVTSVHRGGFPGWVVGFSTYNDGTSDQKLVTAAYYDNQVIIWDSMEIPIGVIQYLSDPWGVVVSPSHAAARKSP